MSFWTFNHHIFREKKTKQNSLLVSQKGQGVLEYVLLLFLVVSLAFGMLYQFNDAFKNYASNYFGNYLACILEYGELPSLGGGPSLGCEAEFEEFSLASGRPAKGFKGLDDGKGTDQSDEDANSGADRSGQAGVGDGSGSNSSPFGSRSSSGSRGNRGAGTRIGAGTATEGDEYDGDDMTISNVGRNGSSARVTEVERRRIPIGIGEVDAEKPKVKPKISKKDFEGGPTIIENRRLPVREPTAAKKSTDEDTAIDLGFGGYLRILFIAAIIIALFILLGSQGLQISKEWD